MSIVVFEDFPTAQKLELIPEILRSGNLLHDLHLIEHNGTECVREYLKANPDINENMQAIKPTRKLT